MMRSGDIAPELKPDEKIRLHLKRRDTKETSAITGTCFKTPSQLKSERLRKKLESRGKEE
jgi:hypothetical protein